LHGYLKWLGTAKGVRLNPDQLVGENLRNAGSHGRRFRHKGWLAEYVNVVLVNQKVGDSRRKQVATAVRMFYRLNDSELQGVFRFASSDSQRKPRGVKIEDVKLVLSMLPVAQRLPLLCELTSGTNIGTILAWTWGQLDLSHTHMRIDYSKRKNNRKPYFTLHSTETVQLLRLWKVMWTESSGRTPTDDDYVFCWRGGQLMDRGWLNDRMKTMARSLYSSRLISSDPTRFTSHALRACFRTEASREEVNMQESILRFLMGWTSGVSRTYDNTDEVRPEAIYRAYIKLEPYLSFGLHPLNGSDSRQSGNNQANPLPASP
jgi:integrase